MTTSGKRVSNLGKSPLPPLLSTKTAIYDEDKKDEWIWIRETQKDYYKNLIMYSFHLQSQHWSNLTKHAHNLSFVPQQEELVVMIREKPAVWNR